MTFNEWLAGMGVDASSLTDARRTTLESAWRAETGELPPPLPVPKNGPATDPFNELIARRNADLARRNAITDACSACMDAHPARVTEIGEVGNTALAQGWTRERTELELLRRFERSNVTIAAPSSRTAVDGKVVEFALLVAAGLPGVEKQFDERTMQRADDAFGGKGLSLGEAIAMTARSRGWRGHSFSGDYENVMRFAFGGGQEGQGMGPGGAMSGGGVPSTYSLPNVFSAVANKSLKVYFEAVDQTWRKVSAIGTARDFKATTDVALTGSLMLQDLPKNGEIKHGTVGEATYANQVKTKALMLGIDRADIINDDLGALNGVTRRLARGAALKFNYDFWTTFLGASSAFFDSSLGNAGSSTLNLSGLDTANALFRTQTDPDSQFMGSEAKILLVGTALEMTALNLMNSMASVATTTANAPLPDGNPFAGRFEVVANPYVGSTTYGGAATRWYLLADPADLPVMETKFLNGNQSPVIEQGSLNWNMLGLSMRCYFDYGCALQERRGGVKEN